MSLLLDLPDDILGFVLALASIGAPELTFGTRPYVESCESDQANVPPLPGCAQFYFFPSVFALPSVYSLSTTVKIYLCAIELFARSGALLLIRRCHCQS
jgi:hypothetical protein